MLRFFFSLFGFETRAMRMARWHCLGRQMRNGYAY
jgi:hypothetical protein